jgi:serine/threonine-protein kinase
VLRGASADRRADVWGLGVVLWELLTGRRLFRKRHRRRHAAGGLDQDIPAPSAVRPELPSLYDAIVLRALERDRERRYASARELGQALTHALFASGVHVGLADLAEWMDELFPGARVRRESWSPGPQRRAVNAAHDPSAREPPPPPELETSDRRSCRRTHASQRAAAGAARGRRLAYRCVRRSGASRSRAPRSAPWR